MSLAKTCLVQLRTGRKCKTCRTRPRKPGYERLVIQKRCIRCTNRTATRGVRCEPCYAYQRARDDAKRANPPRFRIRCYICWEYGHMPKTCPQKGAEL